MNKIVRMKFLLVLLWTLGAANHDAKRRKRFISFPHGSSASFALGVHQGVVGSMYGFATMGTIYGVSYLLPNDTWILEHFHRYHYGTTMKHDAEHEIIVKQRNRRDLYRKLELIIDDLGFDGRSCILKILCESRNYFPKNATNMIFEFFKTIFTFPQIHKKTVEDQHDIQQYSRAYQEGHNIDNCLNYNTNCGVSLFDLAFGNFIK